MINGTDEQTERLKQLLSGYQRLNALTLLEKRTRLRNLSPEESLARFLDLESFAEASGSATRALAFSVRSYRHLFRQREAFRRLAEHAQLS